MTALPEDDAAHGGRSLPTPPEETADRPKRPADPIARGGPYVAAAVVVLGFVLRMRGLSTYWLNADEGIYYSTLTRDSFADFWAEVVANAHPPAFYLLLRGMGYLTWDFVWLRGVSVLFGTAAIWMFWEVGKELGGPGRRGVIAGLVAATWLASSPEAIALSQVIRPYTLVVLLLSGALLSLLRYRSEPDDGYLVGYALCLGVGVLTHYSVALAIAVLTGVIVHDAATRRLRGRSLHRLGAAHALPSAIFVVLYLVHTATVLDSDLMNQALGPGGWLREWLVDSPEAAWRSLVTLQNFHVPQEWRVRTALLLLAAIGVSAASRERVVALLAGGGLVVALGASVLGLYPFGPSRHNAWLVVLTMPALAWLLAHLAAGTPRTRLVGGAGLLALAAVGHPLERSIGGPEGRAVAVRTVASGERAVRRADLAPMVVERLDRDAGPETVLMTEQTYNVLMPLFSPDRADAVTNPDSSALHFSYGARTMVVYRSWDWADRRALVRALEELPRTVPETDAVPDRVLVLAGGWGSALFGHVATLVRDEAVAEQSWVPGLEPDGRVVPRMAALVVETAALPELGTPASAGPPG